MLVRINRELGGNFDLSAFTHRSIYNRDRHRIEMHLISRKAQSVRLLGSTFSFRPGESIHTENSYKYSLERFTALARSAGWAVRESWTDAARMFSVHALGGEPPHSRPVIARSEATAQFAPRGDGLLRFARNGVDGAAPLVLYRRPRPQRHRLPGRDHDQDRRRHHRQLRAAKLAAEPGRHRSSAMMPTPCESCRKLRIDVLEQDGPDQEQQQARRPS